MFYDGANDFRTQGVLNSIGRGGSRLFANDLDSQALLDIERKNGRASELMEIARDGPTILEPSRRSLSPEAVGRFAAQGYGAAGETARVILESLGIERHWFYQPTLPTRRPPRRNDEPVPGSELRALREGVPQPVAAGGDRPERGVRRRPEPGLLGQGSHQRGRRRARRESDARPPPRRPRSRLAGGGPPPCG